MLEIKSDDITPKALSGNTGTWSDVPSVSPIKYNDYKSVLVLRRAAALYCEYLMTCSLFSVKK